jgi:hypothetical protein
MRRILIYVAAALFLAASFVSAQPPDTLWTQTFGGNAYDDGRSVQQTADGGYIVAGSNGSYGAGYSDVFLIKTDASGTEQWSHTFGGSGGDHGYSVQQTSDGGYIIAGVTESFGAGLCDVWLIKTDAGGDTLWSQTFGGSDHDYGHSVQQTSDGGYIIAGYTQSYGAGGRDVYLIKTDASGIEQWGQTFGGVWYDEGHSVQQTSDGGYIIAGYTRSYGAGGPDVWLIKTDAGGDTLWSQTFGGGVQDGSHSVQQTSDGGYIIAGHFQSGDKDVWLIKTDASGNELWSQTFGGSVGDYGRSVQQTSDGGFIIAGYTASYGAGANDVYLIKTDASGIEQWSQTFGGSNHEYGYCVRQNSDDGYIITGYKEWGPGGYGDVWLIRLGPEGGYPDVTITLTPSGLPIQIPAAGGSFDFNVMVTNNEITPVTFSAWTDITLPNSTIYGPVIGPLELTLPGGGSIDRDRTQVVPANAPAGMYTYNAYVGDNLGNVWNEDQFEFEKLTTGDGSIIGDWANYGEDFRKVGGGSTPSLQDNFMLIGSYPNPFNPTTIISFSLPDAVKVSLSVYDISGRLVASLVNGWRDAGEHEVTFDGSDLPSGIYLARLTTGDFQQTKKLVLVK